MVGSCKAGEIEKIGYSYTKKNTHKQVVVDPVCIKDKGKPGKGKKLIIMPEQDVGLLSKYGYNLKILFIQNYFFSISKSNPYLIFIV